jgi:hypothetical protein
VRTTEVGEGESETPSPTASTGEIPQQMTAALEKGEHALWERADSEE